MKANSHDEKQRQKERIKKRYSVTVDPENYRFIPAKKQPDYYDDAVQQKVAIYVRVSTDDIRQTTSYELQKKYYEEFVEQHPNWTLVHIYADEGISGTSTKHRDEFNQMINDCKAGKISLIITKSVSRFARNVEDFVGTVRNLAEMRPPVGVFFESEAIFSLNDDSQMALTFQAAMAEEESHTRSRSMEASLKMRLDHGIPLTPKLYGYTHDPNGELIINQEEAPTVKLIFYMYLYGYTTQQIADTLTEIGRRSYRGLPHWSPGVINHILRNERHCGDVLTRKTFTENYRTHRTLKNNGDRSQSWYYNHHEAIISRDDFNAVQRMLDNAKYGNKSILPELRVVDSGFLKGYVAINPRWAGFKEEDYIAASQSAYASVTDQPQREEKKADLQFKVEAGDFDLRGFEVARSAMFEDNHEPQVTFSNKDIKFNKATTDKFKNKNYVELLVNPFECKFAVRPTSKDNRNGVFISKAYETHTTPRSIPSGAFKKTLFSLFQWNHNCKYRIRGRCCENNGELVFIFDANEPEALFSHSLLNQLDPASESQSSVASTPLLNAGKHIRAIPAQWTSSFGQSFYLHELSYSALEQMTADNWEILLQGKLFESGAKMHVTDYKTLRNYIKKELGGTMPMEEKDE